MNYYPAVGDGQKIRWIVASGFIAESYQIFRNRRISWQSDGLFLDAARPGFIRSLKIAVGDNDEDPSDH